MWRYAKASVRGSSHEKGGTECQDAIGCRLDKSGVFSAVVSDGAGSAPLGGLGAALCVSAVLDFISRATEDRRSDWVDVLKQAGAAAINAIEIEAVKSASETRNYAATLLAVVLTDTGGAALHIGDGVIFIREPAGEWAWVFWPQKGEFANTTHFITDADAPDHIQATALANYIDAICLVTDGLETLSLKFSDQCVFDPFLTGLFCPLDRVTEYGEATDLSDKLCQFLSSDRVRARVDDDCSIVMASRLPESRDDSTASSPS